MSHTKKTSSNINRAIIPKRPVRGIEIKVKDLSKPVRDFILGTNENLDNKDKLQYYINMTKLNIPLKNVPILSIKNFHKFTKYQKDKITKNLLNVKELWDNQPNSNKSTTNFEILYNKNDKKSIKNLTF